MAKGVFLIQFLSKIFSRVFINVIIVKTISSRKPLSPEFTYKVISIANIVHTYFSLLTLYVHSHSQPEGLF